jgi:hypothetical protein
MVPFPTLVFTYDWVEEGRGTECANNDTMLPHYHNSYTWDTNSNKCLEEQPQLSQRLSYTVPPPLVIISDDAIAKETLYELDPKSVRYIANATIVHVDRSKTDRNNLLVGSLQVWADVLLLAQATCLVESLSSFSSLARRISMSEFESGAMLSQTRRRYAHGLEKVLEVEYTF